MDKSIKIWDIEKNQCIHTFLPSEKLELTDMQQGITYNKRNIISISLDGTINIFPEGFNQKFPEYKIYGHKSSIISLLFSKKQNSLVSLDFDNVILMIKPEKIEKISSQIIKQYPISMIKDINETPIIVSSDGLVFSLNLEEKSLQILCDIKALPIQIVASKIKATTCYILSQSIVWEASNNSAVEKLKVPNNSTAIELLDEDKTMIIGTKKGEMLLFDIKEGKLLNTMKINDREIAILSYCKESNLLAIAEKSKYISIWDIKAGKRFIDYDLLVHENVISGLCWDSKGKNVYSCSFDWNVSQINIETKKIASIKRIHSNGCTCIELLNDNNVFTGGNDFAIKKIEFK